MNAPSAVGLACATVATWAVIFGILTYSSARRKQLAEAAYLAEATMWADSQFVAALLRAGAPDSLRAKAALVVNREWPGSGDACFRDRSALGPGFTLVLADPARLEVRRLSFALTTPLTCPARLKVLAHVKVEPASGNVRAAHAAGGSSLGCGGGGGCDEDAVMVLNGLVVSPRHRRRGLGQRILAAAERVAAARRARCIYLSTVGAATVHFYAACGYDEAPAGLPLPRGFTTTVQTTATGGAAQAFCEVTWMRKALPGAGDKWLGQTARLPPLPNGLACADRRS
jgi:GNAT superfamily N-acetyltransferase